MTVELLIEHHLEFLSLKGGCTGSSEYTLVKMPHCWKSHVAAHICSIPAQIPNSGLYEITVVSDVHCKSGCFESKHVRKHLFVTL